MLGLGSLQVEDDWGVTARAASIRNKLRMGKLSTDLSPSPPWWLWVEPKVVGPDCAVACLETASWRSSGLELNSLSPTQAGLETLRQLPPWEPGKLGPKGPMRDPWHCHLKLRTRLSG